MLTFAEYVSACRRLFDADRYGWSDVEQWWAEEFYASGLSVESAVHAMNVAWVGRYDD